MKTSNVKGFSFGVSVVNAGQRNVSVEPQVIATSTQGGFRLTPAVSRVLGIGNGDYAMFISNVDGIDEAIRNKDAELAEYCQNDLGLDISSPEAMIALHKEFDQWFIAKGIKEYDAKGNMKVVSERLTKKDKLTYVSQNFDAMLTAALESEELAVEVRDALTRDGVTREEQTAILIDFVNARELPKYRGSKCANPAGLNGAGVSVTFTDSNVWNQLKADLKDDATKFNRIFDVDLDDIKKFTINNGYTDVEVSALLLGDYTDKEPARRGESGEESVEESELED